MFMPACTVASVVAGSLWTNGLVHKPTRFLWPWDTPDKNTGVGCHILLQGIFLTQGLNLHLLSCIVGRVFYPCIAGGFFTTKPLRKPFQKYISFIYTHTHTHTHIYTHTSDCWFSYFRKLCDSNRVASSCFPTSRLGLLLLIDTCPATL